MASKEVPSRVRSPASGARPVSHASSGWFPGAVALVIVAIALLVTLQLGCTCDERHRGGGGDAAVVGRYTGGVITSEDLQREVSRLPLALRQQFDTPNGRREMVAALIDKRLLAQEAERRGFRGHPDIRRQIEDLEQRLMIQALLADEERSAAQPAEPEERAWYQAHQAELAQPERVRVGRILAAARPGSTPAQRAQARSRLERLAARVRKGEPFAKVAAEGDGPEKSHGGDMGLLARGNTADKQLEAAAFKLTKPHELSAVVECADGLAVLQLQERREGRVPSFEEARGEVENRLAPLRQRKVFDELIAKLRQKGNTSIEMATAPR